MLIHHDVEDNWSALAVAICYKKPLTVEAAFRVYQTGTARKREEPTKRIGRQTLEEIDRLRKAGCRWCDINQMLCLSAADSYYRHYKAYMRRRENEARERTEAAETAQMGTPGSGE